VYAERYVDYSSMGPDLALGGTRVVKPNQVYVRALSVFGNFQQIDHAHESRFTRELGRNLGQTIGVIESTSISPSSMR
jgi:hypothetical protein